MPDPEMPFPLFVLALQAGAMRRLFAIEAAGSPHLEEGEHHALTALLQDLADAG